MSDLITKLLAHIRGMWRFRWAALAVAWLVALAGWYVVYTMPDHYESTAQVYVDTDSVLRPLLKGISTDNDVISKVELMARALMSRPNLLEVAQKTDLDLRAGTEKEMNNLLVAMRSKLSIQSSGKNVNVYSISFRDTEPEMTRDVVQMLLGTFVGDTLREGREKSTEAIVFIEKQIEEYEQRLTQAEERLADFKKRNVGLMPRDNGTYYQRLENALATLAQLQSQIAIKSATRAELVGQLKGEEPTFGLITAPTKAGPGGSSYDGQIATLDDRLSQLRMTFTDKHPDVIGVLNQIEDFKARRDEELAQRAPASDTGVTGYNALDLNPVYQQMRMALSNTEVELEALNTQLRQQRAVVNELRQSVDSVPEVEAQLARLNRDYAVTTDRYNALLQRLETARMGDEANTTANDMRFRVIEPPRLPLEPYGPNRMLFFSVVLGAALAIGLAFALLMDQIRPVFITRNDLATRTGLPVLGSIGVVLMPRQRFVMRMQKAAFLAGLVGLIIVYGVVVAYEEPFIEILRSIEMRGGI